MNLPVLQKYHINFLYVAKNECFLEIACHWFSISNALSQLNAVYGCMKYYFFKCIYSTWVSSLYYCCYICRHHCSSCCCCCCCYCFAIQPECVWSVYTTQPASQLASKQASKQTIEWVSDWLNGRMSEQLCVT